MSDFAAGDEYRIGGMRMKRNAMYVLMGVVVCAAETMAAANAAPVDGNDAFDSFAAAVKCFSDMFATDGIWPVVSRGGSSMFISDTVTYDHFGDVVGRSSVINQRNSSGTIMAFPVGDFKEIFAFGYKAGRKSAQGLVVAVDVQISAPKGMVSERDGDNAIIAMVKNGSSLSDAVGSKPCRIMPVQKTAAKRFGASSVKPVYDRRGDRVVFVLGGIDSDKADESYLPATKQGLGKKERLAQQALTRQKDTRKDFYASHTTIYYPAGGDPEYYRKLYEQGKR